MNSLINIEQLQRLTVESIDPNEFRYRDSVYQAELRKLPLEQLPRDNETRWLLLYPPEYRNLSVSSVASERALSGQGMGNDYWLDVFKEAGNVWEEHKLKHLTLLRAVYKVVTRLEGITPFHDPKYVMRDLDLLKKRVLLFDRLQYRLAEIHSRDAVTVGRSFTDYRNEGYVCTVTAVYGDKVVYKANFNGAQPSKYDYFEFKKLISIGVRKLRFTDSLISNDHDA